MTERKQLQQMASEQGAGEIKKIARRTMNWHETQKLQQNCIFILRQLIIDELIQTKKKRSREWIVLNI